MDIVTVTLNPCIDKTFQVERVAPDRKLQAREVRQYPGGGGLNVARAVTKLGGEARALWSCGGPTGDLLRRLLADEGVAETGVAIDGEVRENLIVTETSSSQQYRFGMPGPELTEDDRKRWRETLDGLDPTPAYVVFSGSRPPGAPLDWYGELVRGLPERTRVVVDTKKDALAEALEAGVFLVKPNVRELGDVLDRELEDDDAIEQAASGLVERGAAEVVLVSLGQAGALLVTAEGSERLFAPTVRPRSRVGAGDSTVGGCVLALARGRPLREAVQYGMAAGAATVMTPGTALCRREDTERLYAHVRREPRRD
ncbi:MAG: 1-phosphofructokinase family hexose kinase [Myxococcota bacterium]|nr:1-phosphofructokinase family hexose kinase [Myxococcota bacterium]